MIANQGIDPRRKGPSAYHGMGIGLGQRHGTQLSGTALDRAKQWPFRIAVYSRLQVRVQVFFQLVMAGHRVLFATFLA
ncbi:hypothetical protein D3C80_1572190 [compost metagenome]